MSQVIELKDDVFRILQQNAENEGVTPEVWIEKKVKELRQKSRIFKANNNRRFSDIIGTIDSSAQNQQITRVAEIDETIGNSVLEKMQRIGLKVSK